MLDKLLPMMLAFVLVLAGIASQWKQLGRQQSARPLKILIALSPGESTGRLMI
jgi:hypothetical protein